MLPSHVSLSLSDCRANCVAGSDRCAVSLLLFMKGEKKGEKKSHLVLHMSALFLELLRSWPHYTDLHTHCPFLSLSLCLSKLIAECRWALFHKKPTDCVVRTLVCVCLHVCEFHWPRRWEGSDRGLDMLKRQSKWVFLKQWGKYHRFIPGQFMSPYLFLKHVTLATAEW